MALLKAFPESPLWIELDNWLRATKAPRTVTAFDRVIRLFLAHHQRLTHSGSGADFIASCTRADVDSFLAAQKEAGLAAATRRKRAALLKSFFKWTYERHFRAEPLSFDLPRKGPQVRPTKTVSGELILRTVYELLRWPSRYNLETAAMVVLLFYGGLRRGEVPNVRLCDVTRTQAGALAVWIRESKGRRSDHVTIAEQGAWIIEEWCKQLRAEGAAENEPLFESGQCAVYWRYKKLFGTGPHSARATFCSELLSDGNDYGKVRDSMRLSSLDMVSVYDKRRKQLGESCSALLDYRKKKHGWIVFLALESALGLCLEAPIL